MASTGSKNGRSSLFDNSPWQCQFEAVGLLQLVEHSFAHRAILVPLCSGRNDVNCSVHVRCRPRSELCMIRLAELCVAGPHRRQPRILDKVRRPNSIEGCKQVLLPETHRTKICINRFTNIWKRTMPKPILLTTQQSPVRTPNLLKYIRVLEAGFHG